ncbi:hypothetical protein BZA05DRAFT_345167 [Tricharina praecox]|uniref:uncharacterized protein n=1 Tax=Tricharina praecox TaxID=43433 RepID=UPI00221FDB42|nr:uncharacterized protein BZA05DRAFT_345167 [Tricharina praecox]KAI5840887.1 hypothetical protein BZA05DRAFT_345167 [Tricharina praecox]
MEGDGGADVSEFLLRIRELGDKRDKEDADRARQLEAEILAGREARRARRDERARSLSPQKDSPGGTPISLKSAVSRPETRDSDDTAERVDTGTNAALAKLTGKLTDATETTSSEAPLRRTPTLSWQRRPKSFHGSVYGGLPKLSPSSPNAGESTDSPEKSRAQITANLQSKEPTWFSQTRERAATSGALRKAEEERMESVSKMSLPGMSPSSGDSSIMQAEIPELQKASPRTAFDSLSTTRVARSGSLKSERFPPSDLARSPSIASNASGRFEVEDSRAAPLMSPSQERLSPDSRDRTPSPTKGVGGFVQSARLKREGSMHKRYGSRAESVSSGSGHSRSNSVFARGNEPVLLPTSRGSTPAPEDLSSEPEAEPVAKPIRGRSNTTSEGLTNRYSRRDSTPPASPGKTFEPKRWSPTKSSWLETALKKGTDNPQPPMAPAKPQPKPVELSPFGQPPVLPAKTPILYPNPIPSYESLKKANEKNAPETTGSYKRDDDTEKKLSAADKPAIYGLNRTNTLPSSTGSNRNSMIDLSAKPTSKPKEQINFRASLKPRPHSGKGDEKEELPFLNAMSRLKSTRTQNYRAPNELKDNILAGKANLNNTGGVQKAPKIDPLKESLLSAKGSLRHSDSPVKPTSSSFSPVEPRSKTPGPMEPRSKTPGPADMRPKTPGPPVKKGTLAERFNPNLLGLLSRGPPTAASGNAFRSSRGAEDASKSTGGSAQSAVPLNHVCEYLQL